MRYRTFATCTLVASLSLTAGCGTTQQDRTISGAGLGASAGAIIGAVTGVSVLEAAVLGALGGGLTGAVTNNSQVNMGDPLWKKNGGSSQTAAPVSNVNATANAAAPAPANADLKRTIGELQARLAARGYNPGPIDGVCGEQTRSAIRAYQKDRGMSVDGQISQNLVASLAN